MITRPCGGGGDLSLCCWVSAYKNKRLLWYQNRRQSLSLSVSGGSRRRDSTRLCSGLANHQRCLVAEWTRGIYILEYLHYRFGNGRRNTEKTTKAFARHHRFPLVVWILWRSSCNSCCDKNNWASLFLILVQRSALFWPCRRSFQWRIGKSEIFPPCFKKIWPHFHFALTRNSIIWRLRLRVNARSKRSAAQETAASPQLWRTSFAFERHMKDEHLIVRRGG